MEVRPLWEKWRKDFWRIFRFGITGTICSLIHYGVYCLMLLFSNATISYTAGYIVGLICNYGLTTYFTFREKPTKSNAVGFAGSHIINYLLEIGLLNAFLWIGASKWLAPILVMIVVVPINFVLLRFVFVRKQKGPGKQHPDSQNA
jgi:putative flippase GtrA